MLEDFINSIVQLSFRNMERNSKMKKCIFHIPNYIEQNAKSAPGIRPWKMLQAFRDIGYEVDVVMGYGKERKAAIKEIKENIKNGVKYEFLYSESSTMPTTMTEKHHLPIYFDLDFGFFRFCKKHDIPIGLFYRDFYWKFDVYKESVAVWKRIPAIIAYKYDLKQYKKYLDKFYLPVKQGYQYLSECGMENILDALPPGCVYDANILLKRKEYINAGQYENSIHLFYVGGMAELYGTEILFKVIPSLPQVHLTFCCRDEEWKKNEEKYKQYLADNIEIIHKSGIELIPYYKRADVCMVYQQPSLYTGFSISYKTFEYLGNGIPSIASNGTAIGNFVKKHDIGWSIDYDEASLKELLCYILDNPKEIVVKTEHCLNEVKRQTWECRALKVENDLKRG